MSLYPEAVFIKSANALSQFVPDTGGEVALVPPPCVVVVGKEML